MRVLLPLVACGVLAAAALAGNRPPPAETNVVRTGAAPCGTAVGEGVLWVGVYGAGELLKLAPDSGRVLRRFPVGRWACRVTIAAGAAWVTRDRADELVRVDLGNGRLRRLSMGALPFDVTAAEGSVWMTAFGTGVVARLDAARGRLTRVYRDGPRPAGIASCGGRIWVGHGGNATWLTSIDPETHRLARLDVQARSPAWPRCVGRALWVTTPRGVLRIRMQAPKVLARLRLDGTPAEAAAGPDGLVWVTDKKRSLVHRVGARRPKVVSTFPAGPGAYSLARIGGAMWVTSFAGADVRRYEP